VPRVLLALVLTSIACLAACGESSLGVDAASDADTDADLRCDLCTSTQICVQYFDGFCNEFRVECQERGAGCTGTGCNGGCDFAQCQAQGDAGIFTCTAPTCGGEMAGALHCYGP